MPDPKTIAQPVYLVDEDGNMVASAIRPNVFKNAFSASVGNTAVWVPSATKKFRLMRYYIAISGNSIINLGGLLTVKLLDGVLDIGQNHRFYLPALALGGYAPDTPWIDLGNGIVSSNVNNTLNLNLSANIIGGVVNVICIGREE